MEEGGKNPPLRPNGSFFSAFLPGSSTGALGAAVPGFGEQTGSAGGGCLVFGAPGAGRFPPVARPSGMRQMAKPPWRRRGLLNYSERLVRACGAKLLRNPGGFGGV